MKKILENKNIRIYIKCLLILVGVMLIGLIVRQSGNIVDDRIQPEGEYIRLQDVIVMSEAMLPELAESNIFLSLGVAWEEDKAALLSYGQYNELMNEIITYTRENNPVNQELNIPTYEHEYKEEHFLLKNDWYQSVDYLIAYLGLEGIIEKKDIGIVVCGEQAADMKGQNLAEHQLLSVEGQVFSCASDDFMKYSFCEVRAYCKEDALLSMINVIGDEVSFSNVWITEAQNEGLQFFYQGYEVAVENPDSIVNTEYREQIADISFKGGRLKKIDCKTEKISGKIIRIANNQVTIEGVGTYELSDKVKLYRLYGELSSCGIKDIAVGYSFTDFVLDRGKICAALIARQEAMEYIRVAIHKTGYAGRYHSEVKLVSDSECEVIYGKQEERKTETLAAGEVLDLKSGSKYLKGNQLAIIPKVNTGRITLLSVERTQGNPSYRGSMEVMDTDAGLVVINEVLMEEYLYSVVPSEMPAAYPLEALKAQSVCARTYAYRHMMNSSLSDIGVHVDDSVAFQVYNNISEHTNTTKAIKETTGQMLYYNDEPAGTYYYSTSCGYGTNASIWKSESPEDTSYIAPTVIGSDDDSILPEELIEEEVFEQVIEQINEGDYETEEAWYRWEYKVEALDYKKIEENLKKRYQINSKLVLTKNKSGEFVSEDIGKIGKIKDIYCEKRLEGGVMDELIIITDKGTYKVISENTIRYILNDGSSKVKRMDGSEVDSPSLLPSAFMIIDVEKNNGYITGYSITGGGYGHGVGMSQNGAKAMGNRGLTYDEILSHFYQKCEIVFIY